MRVSCGFKRSVAQGPRAAQERQAGVKGRRADKAPLIAGLVARMRPVAGISSQHEFADAELHRQSARAILDTHQHGAL